MILCVSLLLGVSHVLCRGQCPETCGRVKGSQDPPCDKSGQCSEGCKSGFHGAICSLPCDINCLNNKCHQQDGTCHCKSGYKSKEGSCRVNEGVRCEEFRHCRNNKCTSGGRGECLDGCEAGWFGKLCDTNCSKNCICDDEYCTSCIPGWYGEECKSRCSIGCIDGTCDRNGTCVEGCKTGSYGEKCELKCSRHCVSWCDRDGQCIEGCLKGYYGKMCKSTCPQHCQDSLCDLRGCQKCTSGYYGTFCDETCQHCMEGMCHQDTRECARGCEKGYFGESCELECPQQCIDGLCDLQGTCTACKTEFYGPRCSRRCEGCVDGRCDKDTGECSNEEDQESMDIIPYCVAGGVTIFIIGAVLAYVLYRLKRIDGMMYYGARWRRRPDVGEYLRAETRPGVVPGYSELDDDTPPRVCPIIHTRPTSCTDPCLSDGNNLLSDQQDVGVSVDQDDEPQACTSSVNIHPSDRLLSESGTSLSTDNSLDRPDSYVLPNYIEINEELITSRQLQRKQLIPRMSQSSLAPFSDRMSIQSDEGNATGGDISIPLIAECSWNTETKDSQSDRNFWVNDENYDHPFTEGYCPRPTSYVDPDSVCNNVLPEQRTDWVTNQQEPQASASASVNLQPSNIQIGGAVASTSTGDRSDSRDSYRLLNYGEINQDLFTPHQLQRRLKPSVLNQFLLSPLPERTSTDSDEGNATGGDTLIHLTAESFGTTETEDTSRDEEARPDDEN